MHHSGNSLAIFHSHCFLPIAVVNPKLLYCFWSTFFWSFSFYLKIFFSFILFDPSLSRCFFLPPYNWYHRQLCIFYHCFNKVMTFLGWYLSQLHHAQRSLTKELWGFTHLFCLASWIKKQFIPSGKLF